MFIYYRKKGFLHITVGGIATDCCAQLHTARPNICWQHRGKDKERERKGRVEKRTLNIDPPPRLPVVDAPVIVVVVPVGSSGFCQYYVSTVKGVDPYPASLLHPTSHHHRYHHYRCANIAIQQQCRVPGVWRSNTHRQTPGQGEGNR